MSYERLVAVVQAGVTASALALEFHSPTAFASNTRNVTRLFPEPAPADLPEVGRCR